jgi:CRP-like cAMP-binding protein
MTSLQSAPSCDRQVAEGLSASHKIYIQQYLFRHLKQKRLKPGEACLREGQVYLNVSYIEEGLFKSVYVKRGKTYINWFMKESDVMIAVRSFFEQIPSTESIVALATSLIYYIDFATYQYLNNQFKSFQVITNKLMAYYYERCQDRTELLRLFRDIFSANSVQRGCASSITPTDSLTAYSDKSIKALFFYRRTMDDNR